MKLQCNAKKAFGEKTRMQIAKSNTHHSSSCVLIFNSTLSQQIEMNALNWLFEACLSFFIVDVIFFTESNKRCQLVGCPTRIDDDLAGFSFSFCEDSSTTFMSVVQKKDIFWFFLNTENVAYHFVIISNKTICFFFFFFFSALTVDAPCCAWLSHLSRSESGRRRRRMKRWNDDEFYEEEKEEEEDWPIETNKVDLLKRQ